MLANDVSAKANRVLSFGPTDVAAVVELRVVAVVRHEVVLGAKHGEGRCTPLGIGDIKLRPASFKIAGAVDSGNAEDVSSLFLRDVKLLGVGHHPRHTENRIHHESRGGNEAARYTETDGVSVSRALVADKAADFGPPNGAENLGIQGIVLGQSKMAAHPELFGRNPVDLGITGKAVESHVRRAEVVVIGHVLAGAGKIRRGHHLRQLCGGRADATGGNHVGAVAGCIRLGREAGGIIIKRCGIA